MNLGRTVKYGGLGAAASRAFGAALTVSLACLMTLSKASAETALVLGSAGGGEAEVAVTLAELQALPQTTIVTVNEFANGSVAYRGPLVREVIAGRMLEEADTLRFTAANEYAVDIPMSDFLDYDTILALEADGHALSRREKGPIWLMYPISDHPELGEPPYIDRLIWQVVRIDAL